MERSTVEAIARKMAAEVREAVDALDMWAAWVGRFYLCHAPTRYRVQVPRETFERLVFGMLLTHIYTNPEPMTAIRLWNVTITPRQEKP